MRNVSLVLVLVFLCGCSQSAVEVPNQKEKSQLDNDRPDLFQISDLVFERDQKLGYSKLTGPEKVFLCVWSLESEVNNGGFDQYYFNSAGDHALDTVQALQTIGANHTAQLVKQANSLFGPDGPSVDRHKRQKQLDGLSEASKKKLDGIEEEFLEYKDNLQELLTMFVKYDSREFPAR